MSGGVILDQSGRTQPTPNLWWDCQTRGCYKKALPDFARYNGCFEHGIKWSDIDGVVERNRQFIWGEWKNGRIKLDRGQDLLFRRLVERGDTAMFVSGLRQLEYVTLWTPSGEYQIPAAEVPDADIEISRSWYQAADTGRVDQWHKRIAQRFGSAA